MKSRKGNFETRATRSRREFWKRLAIWVFIIFFALSVAGGLVVVSTSLSAH